ncbi:MAG: hypothetical protein R2715_20010 [Ilumatobacteraceae bacterium]
MGLQMCLWKHGAKKYQYEACSLTLYPFSNDGVIWMDLGTPTNGKNWWTKPQPSGPSGAWDWTFDVGRFMIKDLNRPNKLMLVKSCGAYCFTPLTPSTSTSRSIWFAPRSSWSPRARRAGSTPANWNGFVQGLVAVVQRRHDHDHDCRHHDHDRGDHDHGQDHHHDRSAHDSTTTAATTVKTTTTTAAPHHHHGDDGAGWGFGRCDDRWHLRPALG